MLLVLVLMRLFLVRLCRMRPPSIYNAIPPGVPRAADRLRSDSLYGPLRHRINLSVSRDADVELIPDHWKHLKPIGLATGF